MLIAVGVNEFGMITAHLGKTDKFYIFELKGEVIEFIEERNSESDKSEHIIKEINDCSAVISGGIGGGMAEGLKKGNIIPVVERGIIDPKSAIKKHFIN